MLCFQIVESGNAIQIYCDSKGVTALIAKLERVREQGHLHLRVPVDLADQTPFGDPAVSEIIITTGGDDD
jgi:hypothetical protein